MIQILVPKWNHEPYLMLPKRFNLAHKICVPQHQDRQHVPVDDRSNGVYILFSASIRIQRQPQWWRFECHAFRLGLMT